MLSEEEAAKATQTVGDIADAASIPWAIVGGYALNLYDGPRMTKDVDIIAPQLLPEYQDFIVGPLKQGGVRYGVQVGELMVGVDWIVRADAARIFYQTALRDATEINGWPIITPEWLVILKAIAGRFKDQEDGIWLLRQKGLVNRKLIKSHIVALKGADGWALFSAAMFRWFDLADGKIRDGDENESYRRI